MRGSKVLGVVIPFKQVHSKKRPSRNARKPGRHGLLRKHVRGDYTMNDIQTRSQLIHDRAFALVLDAKRWPQTKQVAHAFVCRALKWAAVHNQRQLAEKLSGFSLQIGES